MRPEIAKRLEGILDNHQKQDQAAHTAASERETAQAKNLRDFDAKKEQVIKPALQEIVELYKTKGIALDIDEWEERPNREGGTQSPAIRLNMAAVYPSRHEPKPEFRLIFAKDNRSVSLYASTGASAGPGATVSLDALTADWIQDEFAKYQSKG